LLIAEGKILTRDLFDEKAAFFVRSCPGHVPTSQINNRHSSIANQPNVA
jgi:hypothetical protein